MGVRLALAAVAVALAATPIQFLESRQAADGGFAEAGARPDVGLTAWAALGLVASGGSGDARTRAGAYLRAHAADARSETDVALVALARAALGERPADQLERLRAHRPGRLLNATMWTMLALRQAGEPVPPAFARALLAGQHRSGGWSWLRGGAPDSNDTAAAVQALRAAGVRGGPIRRAVAYLRARQNRDGGFELAPGRASDAQSTAWAIQGLLAAGERPGAAAFRYLARLRRPDGSYRYSARYVTTPVWVTAQVVPALARKPFPLD